MTAAGRVLAAALILALLMPPVSLVASAMLPDVTQAPALVYGVTILQELLMFLLPAALLGGLKRQRRTDGRILSGWVLLAVAAGILAVPALRAVSGWWRGVCGVPDRFLPDVNGAGERLLQVLALAVVPAIAEEAFFRGAMLGALRRACSPWTAVLLTTAAFALLHGSLGGLLSHLAIGLILTLLMWHSGNLLAPMAAHMGYNLLIVLGAQYPEWAAYAGGALLTLLAGWLLSRLRICKVTLGRNERLLAALMLLAMSARYFI